MPGLPELEQARARLRGTARETPVYSSETLSRLAGRPVLLKAENLQRTGSFKIRGAFNTVSQLTDEQRHRGVVTASAGNHGQALAWAARQCGAPARIYVPETAPMAKVEAARAYGASCELVVGEGYDDAVEAARRDAEETGATFVHAFEDERVIAGQGTLGLELAEQLDGDATVVVPVGGGGLASGVLLALRGLRPGVAVVGVQAAACAPFAGRSPQGPTIADGIAVKQPGTLTSEILRDLDGIAVVDDERIAQAIVLLLERVKLVVEGAGAASVAAVLAGEIPGEGPVCCILAGGNIDATTLMSVTRRGLTASGRHLVVSILIPDRPGGLLRIVELVAREKANILSINHHREGRNIGVLETEAELTLETRGEEHSQRVVETLAATGWPVERLR